MCWIPPSVPMNNGSLTHLNTVPPPCDFYTAIRYKKMQEEKAFSSLHTFNLQKLLPLSSVEMKIKAFPEWR